LQIFIRISGNIVVFSKIIIRFLLNTSMISHDKIFCLVTFYGYLLICWDAEGVHGLRKVGNPWSEGCTRASQSPSYEPLGLGLDTGKLLGYLDLVHTSWHA